MGERRKSEDRQVELTDAALHIIATKGIAALSTRSLAAQVGLSTGAIFRHFASLEALLDAVVGRVEACSRVHVPAGDAPPRRAPRALRRGSKHRRGQSARHPAARPLRAVPPRAAGERLGAPRGLRAEDARVRARVRARGPGRRRAAHRSARRDARTDRHGHRADAGALSLEGSAARCRSARSVWAACSRSSVRPLSLPRRAERVPHEASDSRLHCRGRCARAGRLCHAVRGAAPRTRRFGGPASRVVELPGRRARASRARFGCSSTSPRSSSSPSCFGPAPCCPSTTRGAGDDPGASGRGTVVAGAERLRLDPAHAVVLAPNVPHAVEPDDRDRPRAARASPRTRRGASP
jgi:AcrR family transcriptional regulator